MIIEIVGWLGAIAVLWAYFLISMGKTQSKSLVYQSLNLVGAFFLIVNTIALKAYPSAFVNIVWLVIAAIGLLKRNK